MPRHWATGSRSFRVPITKWRSAIPQNNTISRTPKLKPKVLKMFWALQFSLLFHITLFRSELPRDYKEQYQAYQLRAEIFTPFSTRQVFWNMKLPSLVEIYEKRNVGSAMCCLALPWRCRYQILPYRWQFASRLLGVIPHKIAIFSPPVVQKTSSHIRPSGIGNLHTWTTEVCHEWYKASTAKQKKNSTGPKPEPIIN
jgi:hypothetical protein